MGVKMQHGLIQGIKRLFHIILLGDRNTWSMLEYLANLKVLKIKSITFSVAVLANLDIRRKCKLSHKSLLLFSRIHAPHAGAPG